MRNTLVTTVARLSVAAVFIASSAAASQQDLSVRLADERPLTTEEISQLLEASEAATVGKAFRMYGGFGGGTFLVGEAGTSITMHGEDRLTHHTRMPATICPGTPETVTLSPEPTGELVVEYERRDGAWTARAKASGREAPPDSGYFLRQVDLSTVEDAGTTELRGRDARGIRIPYEAPATVGFIATEQVLWFDVETLLPVRWVLFIEAPEAMEYGYWIDRDPDLRIELPQLDNVPDCIGGVPTRYPRHWAAALTYLDHSGWAVRTNNYVLVFDSVPGDPAAVEALELALDPTMVQDRKVVFFVSRGHEDHFSESIWRWDEALDNVSYVLGFEPAGTIPSTRQPLQVGSRADVEIAGLRVRTVRSTGEGVGFLVDVDSLTIFYAGDHALWDEEDRESYRSETGWLAEQAESVDVGFFPLAAEGCVGRPSLFEGAVWAVERLDVQRPLPMNAGCREQTRQFAGRLAEVSDRSIRVVRGPGHTIGYRRPGYPVRGSR